MSEKVFISPDKQGWKVKVVSNKKASAICPNKNEAIKEGIKVANNYKAELLVQNLDGKIGMKNSYGNDPRKIKG